MNPTFWQINAGQLLTALGWAAGSIGGALIFSWKMAQMHGQNTERMDNLIKGVNDYTSLVNHLREEINELKSLAHTSQARLSLVEQELRDNRKRGDRFLS